VINDLFTIVTSCFLRTPVNGSVTPLMKTREAKDLRDPVGSNIVQNIPTSSSGNTFLEDRDFVRLNVLINLDGGITVGFQCCMNSTSFSFFPSEELSNFKALC